MKKILVLEGNPAFQKTLVFQDIQYEKVNRAAAMRVYTGGKGTNFCRAGRIFGRAEYELLHFTGGENGRKADELLAEEGIKTFSVKTEAETRCCVTCLNKADGSMTELIEPSFPLTEKDQKEFLLLLEKHLPESSCAAITGSLPDGTNKEFYTQWAEKVLASGKLLFIDAVKGIENTLFLPGKKVLKINKEELFFLSGEKELKQGMERMFEKYVLEVLAVTDGAANAFLAAKQGIRKKYILPVLENVISPLGCGDTASSIFTALFLEGVSPEEAFKTALAAASANCLSADAASFDMEDMEKILKQIKMEDDR